MTIEDSEAVVADPQDSKNGRPSSSQDDLESLVRLLANQSTQLAERVALLEGERRGDDAPDGGGTKIQSIEQKKRYGNNTPSTALGSFEQRLRDKANVGSNNNNNEGNIISSPPNAGKANFEEEYNINRHEDMLCPPVAECPH